MTRYWYGAREDAPSGVSAGSQSVAVTDRESVVGVLTAMRRFHAADAAMRRRTRVDMDMNETDLKAMRFLIAEERAGRPVSPRDLTAHLTITTASTAKMLARLEVQGYLARQAHPSDRRGQVIVATPKAHADVRSTLGAMHGTMFQVAAELSEAERAVVVRFLQRMAEELDPTADQQAAAVAASEGAQVDLA